MRKGIVFDRPIHDFYEQTRCMNRHKTSRALNQLVA